MHTKLDVFLGLFPQHCVTWLWCLEDQNVDSLVSLHTQKLSYLQTGILADLLRVSQSLDDRIRAIVCVEEGTLLVKHDHFIGTDALRQGNQWLDDIGHVHCLSFSFFIVVSCISDDICSSAFCVAQGVSRALSSLLGGICTSSLLKLKLKLFYFRVCLSHFCLQFVIFQLKAFFKHLYPCI